MQIFAEACRCVLLIRYIQKMKKLKEVVLYTFKKVAVHSCFFTSLSMLFYPLGPLSAAKYPLQGVASELLTPFFFGWTLS